MYVPFAKDTLQKLSFLAFAQAILIMMGDSRLVKGFYPTELIIPTFRKRFMDGVVELDDGSLMNFEFQSGNLTEKFLLRCAQYAINLRVIAGKCVETVIFSTGLRKNSKRMAFISKFFFFKPTKILFYKEFDGSKRLLNIKNKIENQEKLSDLDCYNLIFIPLMGNVDRVNVAFEVFKIVNNKKLFTEDQHITIKKCQYIVAQIIADNDEKLFEKFWKVIRMNNDFLVKYETDLINNTTKKVTEEVTEEVTEQVTERVTSQVTKSIAKNLKDVLPDKEIAKRTGLSLEVVQKL